MKRTVVVLVVSLGWLVPGEPLAQGISTTSSWSFPKNTVYAEAQLNGLGNTSNAPKKYEVTLWMKEVLFQCVNKPGNSYVAQGQPFRVGAGLTAAQDESSFAPQRNGQALSTIAFKSDDEVRDGTVVTGIITAAVEAYKFDNAGAYPCRKNWYVNEVIVLTDEMQGSLLECLDVDDRSTCRVTDELRVAANLLVPFPMDAPGVLPRPEPPYACSTNDQAVDQQCDYHLKVVCSDSRRVFSDFEVKPTCDQVQYCSCACTAGSTAPCKY